MRVDRRRRFLAAVSLVAVVAVACSSPADDNASQGTGDATGGAASRDEGAAGEDASGGGDVGLPVGEPIQAGRSIIATADVLMDVDDVSRASQRAVDAATAAGGFLAQQEALLAEGRIVLTLRVPTERFQAVLGDVADLGTVVEQHIGTEDVTDQVVDLESRIASARVSVDRLRELLTRSGDVAQLSTVEGELARREADLESLLGQQRVLADRVALATIRIDLRQPEAADPVTEDDDDLPGFMGGLRGGWDGLVTVASVLVTGLGYALPFLVPFAVVGGIWLLVVRRRRRIPAPPAPPSPGDEG
jgi:hypothetical protein